MEWIMYVFMGMVWLASIYYFIDLFLYVRREKQEKRLKELRKEIEEWNDN